MPDYDFAIRTDVRSYYASINHGILTEILHEHVKCSKVRRLLQEFLCRTIDDGGNYEDVTKGIPLGSPLSPLLGALYLKSLDEQMDQLDVFYVRYMDDWVILAPTRWKLRKAIAIMHKTLEELKLDLHPNKTFIGRTEQSFDFLGYRLTQNGVGVAEKTLRHYAEHATRLLEQGADENCLGMYARRWLIWVKSGVTLTQGALSTLAKIMKDRKGLKKLLNHWGEAVWGKDVIERLQGSLLPESENLWVTSPF